MNSLKRKAPSISSDSNHGNNDIDSLFSALKEKKSQKRSEKNDENALSKMNANPRRISSDTMHHGIIKSADKPYIISPDVPVHRIDKETGLPVYKAHLLKIGKGGGTLLCPFECNCCF
mmetsp:Transcript_500/g.507  ORF Transcript_500/g.507 Transcript_500/m.507 type:complete len:118 (-) Transcript_500:140-493(-)